MPKISVIIPSYNHARFIGESINSVLNQTYQDFELIIVDDCSPDNSVEIIKQYSDERITFIVNERNMGAVYTTNLMIKMAKGEYIALLNSDDIWILNKLETQIKFIEENPQYVAVFSDAEIINESGELFSDTTHFYYNIFTQENRSRHEWLRYFFYQGNCLCHPSMLIRKSIYDEVGFYNQLIASLPDFEMWIRICSRYDIYILPNKLIQFRVLNNNQNASGGGVRNIIANTFETSVLLESFCNINTIEVFNQIFPLHTINNISDIACMFAKICLEDARVSYISYGLYKLYTLLSNNYKKYSKFMDNIEFMGLSSSLDIFNFFNLNDAISELYWLEKNNNIFSADFAIRKKFDLNANELFFYLIDIGDVCQIRFDPINIPAKIKLKSSKIQLKNGESYDLNLIWHNAQVINKEEFLFEHGDSQFVFNVAPEFSGIIKAVKFVLEVMPYNKFEVLSLNNELQIQKHNLQVQNNELQVQNNELQVQNNELQVQNNELQVQNNELQVQNNELHFINSQILNSVSYKILKIAKVIFSLGFIR